MCNGGDRQRGELEIAWGAETFGRLLQHRPRELLPLVVLGRHRTDHLFGEPVRPLDQVVLGSGGCEVKAHRVVE
jgi:hypothetical protein